MIKFKCEYFACVSVMGFGGQNISQIERETDTTISVARGK